MASEFSYDDTGNRLTVIEPALSEVEWGGGTTSYTSNSLNQYTADGTVQYTYDDNGNMTFDGVNEYLYDPENRLMQVDVERTTALSTACDTTIPITTGGETDWAVTSVGSYHGGSCAVSGDIEDSQTSRMEMKVVGPGTVTFWWKVSSEYGDCLEFYLDDVYKTSIDGVAGWAQSSAYQITGAGTHTLRWQYVKDSSGTENDDCGWVDYVQWSGFTPEQPPGTWQTLRYNYDHDGRRSEKKYDGQTVLTYVYDGDHCIAEYDANDVLQCKYVYGPGVDQPVCMIEGAATSYYHFDALGSVVALSNAAGNTIQVYDYSVWGQVGASDPNHTNPYMFTARRFDKETGLYYYRARYYNPEIGRFLQTDPIGYDDGMNLYRYCANNPCNLSDPLGTQSGFFFGRDWLETFGNPCEPCGVPVWTDKGTITIVSQETDVVWGKWQVRNWRSPFTKTRYRFFQRDGSQTRVVTKYQVYELRCVYSDGRPDNVWINKWIELESWTETRSWRQWGALRFDAQGYVDQIAGISTTHGDWKVVEQPIKTGKE